MAGLAKVGDFLECGDVIITGSPDVFVGGRPAAYIQNPRTTTGLPGHCHGPTLLYRDKNRTDLRVFINGIEAAVIGDWNVPAPQQSPSKPPCNLDCDDDPHCSQIICTSACTVNAG